MTTTAKDKKKNSIFGSLFRRGSKTNAPPLATTDTVPPAPAPVDTLPIHEKSSPNVAKIVHKGGSNPRQQVTSLRLTRGGTGGAGDGASVLSSGSVGNQGDELFRLVSGSHARQRCESDPTPEFASSLEKDFGFEESNAPMDAVQMLVRVASKQDIIPADSNTMGAGRRSSFNNDERVSVNRRSLQLSSRNRLTSQNEEAAPGAANGDETSSKLKAATLDRLVDYVVTSPEFMETSQVSGFLLTYHSYVDAHGLLAAMASRFDVATVANDVVAQMRTLFVLQKWIDEHWYDFADDEVLLLGVARFAKSRLDTLKAATEGSGGVGGSGTRSEKGGVIQLLNKLSTVEAMANSTNTTAAVANPLSPSSSHTKDGAGGGDDDSGDEDLSAAASPSQNMDTPTPTKFKSQQQFKFLSKNPPPAISKDWPAPLNKALGKPAAVIFASSFMQKIEIARQLTLMEHALYKKITPTEMVAQATHKTEQPPENVRNLINHFNQVTRFVAGTICYFTDLKERAYAYRKWLKIGLALLLLNNYNGLFEVMAGIHSVAIWRLKATKAALPSKMKKLQEQLEAAVSRRGNYAIYRELLSRNTVPVMASVPFIGAALADLSFLEIGQDDTLGMNQKGDAIINFTKHRKVAEVIQLMKKFQDHPYALDPVQDIQQFLDKEIHKPEKMLDDRDLFAMSQVCEPGPLLHRGSSSEQATVASPKATAWG